MLPVLTVAVVLVCLANRLHQDLGDMVDNLRLGGRVEFLSHITEESLDETVEPAEGSIIARDLAVVIPLDPCVDGDRDD